MPEESTAVYVELVRRIFEAADRRDWDVVLSFHAPDSVWDASRFDLGTFEGTDAIHSFFEDWVGAYGYWRVELSEVVDLKNGVVFVVDRQKARPVDTTSYLEAREALVFEWSGRTVARVTAYADVDEARAAAERLAEERG